MNVVQFFCCSITVMMLQSLMWLWLIGFSVFVVFGYQAVNEQVDQELFNFRLQRFEVQAVGLAEAIEVIQQCLIVAMVVDFKDICEFLEACAVQVEIMLSGYAAVDDFQALRTEVE